MIGDAAEPSGTIAARFTDAETAALIDALANAADKARTPTRSALADLMALSGDRPPGAEERDAVLGAARKLWSLLADDVVGLEIRVVRR